MRSYFHVARALGLSRATMGRLMLSLLTSSSISHLSWILIHFDGTAMSSEPERFLAGYVLSWPTWSEDRCLGDPGYYPLRRFLQLHFECRTAFPPPILRSLSRLQHSSHQVGAPRASGKSTSSGKTRNSYPPCKYCGKPTHPSEKCWKEFGKPAWALAASGGKTSSTTSQVEGSSSTTIPSAAGAVSLALSPSELAYIQASRASSLCPPAAPSASLAALTSSLVSYAGGRGSSPGTPSISTPHMTSWVIDSGASSHMTGFPSVLTSYRPETSIPDVRIADGRSCPVLGSGQSRATSSLPLQHVLYIPGFPANLLSISAITKALHCGVFFFPHHCVFQDLDTGRRIGLGRENGRGIYELVADSPSTGLQALFALSASSSSLHDSLLWHCRLGHPSFVKLKETLPWLHLSEFHCESCELGKHHRSSYPLRIGPPTHRPFDLVHCDVWGPAPHTSPTGGKYYMVFVDDYTRASWTYILKSRKEVLSRIQHFLLEIIT